MTCQVQPCRRRMRRHRSTRIEFLVWSSHAGKLPWRLHSGSACCFTAEHHSPISYLQLIRLSGSLRLQLSTLLAELIVLGLQGSLLLRELRAGCLQLLHTL